MDRPLVGRWLQNWILPLPCPGMMNNHDTIAAIASPAGEGAISVIRIAGPEACAVAARACPAFDEKQPRVARLMAVLDEKGQVLDRGLMTYFAGPASYTGEDIVEFSGHGGLFVTRAVLNRLLACGARLAEPGEFTRRAFLLGKLDMTQAEAVMDVIQARSETALRVAQEQLEGALGREAGKLRAGLITLLAHIEAYIDFPEEGIDPETGRHLMERIQEARREIGRLLDTSERGRVLREGLRTVICGEPNAGKSSLLNLLVGFDRAIVSQTPGTTRDTVEESMQWQGFPLRLIDTAGLRETDDSVEQEGMRRTRQAVERADVILEVVDASQAPGRRLELTPEQQARHILVLNKTDLGVNAGWRDGDGVAFSCETGEGLSPLGEAVGARACGGGLVSGQDWVAINARHRSLLEKAEQRLAAAATGLESDLEPEFLALELREALDAIGDMVGKADIDEILGEIFSRFCIGK